MLRKSPRNNSRIKFLRPLAGLLVAGLSFAALAAAQSSPFPTYQVGENQSGTQGPDYPSTLPNPWVASSGQIITPAGTQVYLGPTTRAKAIALNPTGNHTAAVLQMGAPQAVTIFNTITGAVLGTYSTTNIGLISKYNPTGIDPDGSHLGISYTPDGKYLLFSQDGNSFYGTLQQGSFVAIGSVDPTTGLLTGLSQIPVSMDVNGSLGLTNATCFSKLPWQPNGSPGGTNGSFNIPCGYATTTFSDAILSAYPMGIAISSDARTAYVVLDNNNTLTKIDLTQAKPTQGPEVHVGNVPHSVVLSRDGKTAYVSNEGGRIATANDFQEYLTWPLSKSPPPYPLVYIRPAWRSGASTCW